MIQSNTKKMCFAKNFITFCELFVEYTEIIY